MSYSTTTCMVCLTYNTNIYVQLTVHLARCAQLHHFCPYACRMVGPFITIYVTQLHKCYWCFNAWFSQQHIGLSNSKSCTVKCCYILYLHDSNLNIMMLHNKHYSCLPCLMLLNCDHMRNGALNMVWQHKPLQSWWSTCMLQISAGQLSCSFKVHQSSLVVIIYQN